MTDRWDRATELTEGISIDNATGIIYGTVDPSAVSIINPQDQDVIPVSCLYIRTSPAEIWQRYGTGALEWRKVGDGGGGPIISAYLKIVLASGNAEAHIPLETDATIPLLLSTGQQVSLPIGV